MNSVDPRFNIQQTAGVQRPSAPQKTAGDPSKPITGSPPAQKGEKSSHPWGALGALVVGGPTALIFVAAALVKFGLAFVNVRVGQTLSYESREDSYLKNLGKAFLALVLSAPAGVATAYMGCAGIDNPLQGKE